MRPIKHICALVAAIHLLSGTTLAAGTWTWPIRGPVITSYRNGDDPYAAGQHRGIDIGASVGARVVAAAGGTIAFAGTVGSSGLTVSERTADGRFDISYLHLSAIAVHRGEDVPAGAPVGAVGTTGTRSADAPHLHFGVREAGQRTAYRDPLDFLAPPPAGDAPEPTPAPVPVSSPAVHEAAPAPAPAPVVTPVPASAPAAPAAAPALSLPGLPARAAAPGPSATTLSAHRFALASDALPGLRELPSALQPTSGAGARHSDGGLHEAHAQPPHAAPAGPAGTRTATRSPSPASATPARHAGHGIDLGWLAACAGLIAAATALAHPDGTRELAKRGTTTLGALLRPTARRS